MSCRLRLFPLNSVLFPGAALNLHIFEPRYKQMVNECLETGEGFGVALISEGTEAGDPNVMPHDIGSLAEIVDVQPLPFGRFYVSTIGRERFRIREIVSRDPYLLVEADMLEEDFVEDEEGDALCKRVRTLFNEYNELLVELSGQESPVELPGDSQSVSFLVGDALQIAERIKQRLLELDDTKMRLVAEYDFLERLLPQLRRLLERRRIGLLEHDPDSDSNRERAHQQQFFGKYFSLN